MEGWGNISSLLLEQLCTPSSPSWHTHGLDPKVPFHWCRSFSSRATFPSTEGGGTFFLILSSYFRLPVWSLQHSYGSINTQNNFRNKEGCMGGGVEAGKLPSSSRATMTEQNKNVIPPHPKNYLCGCAVGYFQSS